MIERPYDNGDEIRCLRMRIIRLIYCQESNCSSKDIAKDTENSKWIICPEYMPGKVQFVPVEKFAGSQLSLIINEHWMKQIIMQ